MRGRFIYGGRNVLFKSFLAAQMVESLTFLYRYFITKSYVILSYFILKKVHIFIFVQKNKLGLKYWFLPVPSTPCLTVSCPVTAAANSGILEQQDGRLGVVLLNRCRTF